jgi:hypothetical protein
MPMTVLVGVIDCIEQSSPDPQRDIAKPSRGYAVAALTRWTEGMMASTMTWSCGNEPTTMVASSHITVGRNNIG